MSKRLFFLLSLLPAIAQAQYSIDWYKIAGGGGVSTNGAFAVNGTIGQQDASGALSGNGFSLTGGYWSIISVVQLAGAPNLVITHAGNSVIVSWANTGNYTLQQTVNLDAPASWTASNYPTNTISGTNSVTITPPAGHIFFRLANP